MNIRHNKRTGCLVILALAATLLYGCGAEVETTLGSNDPSGVSSAEWLIPPEQVFDGGPGIDGIPALVTPATTDASLIDFLGDDELVIGVHFGGQAKAYPHLILDWHEIVNDEIGTHAFAISFCPLTGSAIAWSRVLAGQTTTFGVSGLLYTTNLMPYDRGTSSLWSQMRGDCVNGPFVGVVAEVFPVVETSWKNWRAMYPNSSVVTTQTGFQRPYGQYPYGDYRTNNHRLLFDVEIFDSRLPGKQRVLGIRAGGSARVYPLPWFGDSLRVANDDLGGVPIVAVGSSTQNIAVAFGRRLDDGTLLSFQPVQNSLPRVMTDDSGSIWNVFGQAVSGPLTGQRLPVLDSYIAYWFAWGAFEPGIEIKGQ